jgi:predicted transcriptional regulator
MNPIPGMRHWPTTKVMKEVWEILDTDPLSILMIQKMVGHDRYTIQGALNFLCGFGLVEKVPASRRTWIGHSRPRSCWVKVSHKREEEYKGG